MRYLYSLALIAIMAFSQTPFAFAQEEDGVEGTLVADVSFSDVSTFNLAEERQLVVDFYIQNNMGTQHGVKYGLHLLSSETNELSEVYIAGEIPTLTEGEKEFYSVSYDVPVYLDGTYELVLWGKTEIGAPLASVSLGNVSFEGTGEYLDISRECFITVPTQITAEADNQLLVGKGDEISVTCKIENKFNAEQTAHPFVLLYKDSRYGEGVAAYQLANQEIIVPSTETQEVSIIVPVQDVSEGRYAVVLAFENGTQEKISDEYSFIYETNTTRAHIINVITDELRYLKGDQARVTVFYETSHDAVLNVAMFDSREDTCGVSDDPIVLPAAQNKIDVAFNVERECSDVVVSASISDESGIELDTFKTVNTKSADTLKIKSYLVVVAVLLLLAGIFTTLKILRGRGLKKVVELSIFVLLIFGGAFAETHVAEAATFYKGYTGYSSSGNRSCTVMSSVSINKSSYEANENISASYSAIDFCNPPQTQAVTDYVVKGKAGSGSSGNMSPNYLTNPNMFGYTTYHNGTFTAPSTPGSYNFNFNVNSFKWSFHGYEQNRAWMTTHLNRQKSAHNSVSVNLPFTVTGSLPNPTANLQASPSSITQGEGSSTLSWSCTNSDSARIGGMGSVATSGSTTKTPSSSTTYTLTCYGSNGNNATDTARITVTAPTPAPSASLSASPSSITQGNSSRLTASCSNATSASINKGVGSVSSSGGSKYVSPSSSTTYTLTCTGAGGSDTDTARVTVNPAPPSSPSASLSASPSSISSGGSSTLSWSSSNATSCSGSGSGFSTGGATSGSDGVSPSSTTTYRVTCTGAGGSDTDTAVVSVSSPPSPPPSPSASLEVRNTTQGGSWTGSNITINIDDEVELRWDSSNASSCSGSNFSTGGDDDGSTTTVTEPSPGSSTLYSVSCTGSGGTDSDSLRVTMVGATPELTTDSAQVRQGESVTLSYNMQGNSPAQCTLIGPGVSYLAGSFSQQTGTIDVTISGDSTFTLDCPGGEADITVEIIPIVFDS